MSPVTLATSILPAAGRLRNRPRLGICLVLVLFASSVFAAEPAAGALRAEAIELARQSRYDQSLAILESLYQSRPQDRGVFYDYLTILSWAERDREVADLVVGLDEDRSPLYVLSAAAKSLRRLGDWEGAERWYRIGTQRFPASLDLQTGLILTITDAGRPTEALSMAVELVKSHPDAPEAWMAQTYAAEAAGQLFVALRSCQEMLSRQSEHREARRQQILLLDKLGASHRAWELAQRFPDTITPDEKRRLRGSRDAEAVRWGTLPPVSEETRFADTERALIKLEDTQQAAECQGAEGQECFRRNRIDRLVALRDRYRMAEVIDDYRQLSETGEPLPDYALEAVADAYLYQRHPEQARDLYREIVGNNPQAYEAQLGLFFALVETQEFNSALEQIEAVVAAEPIWQHPGGKAQRSANWQRLEGETFSALGYFFADDFVEAEQRLTVMTDSAPANTDLLRELGTVYLARGWPRRAQEVFERGLALEPEHRGLRIGQADSSLALRQFARAGQQIADLLTEYPEDRQVQRLGRMWQAHRMRELRLDIGFSNSSGNVEGDQEWAIETRLFSQPFSENFRLFTGFSHTQAEFPEGDGDWQRYTVGLEYAAPDLVASLEANLNAGESSHPGLYLGGLWYLDDYWSLPFAAELFSRDTPLRAIRNGIRAHALSLGLNYRAHESRSLGLSGQILDFTDGNLRARLGLSGTQRLLTFPKQKWTAFGELSGSRNNRSDAPYFNPDSDLTLLIGLEHLWRIYRRYERSFHQRVRLSGGHYWQDGYGGDEILGIEYAHIWEAAYRFNLSYGIGRQRRIYDGDAEWSNTAFLSLNWRF